MGKKEIADDLRALSQEKGVGSGQTPRSDTARLWELLEEVEGALAEGVRREAIVASLQKHGFVLTLRGFQTALTRLRKRKAAQGPTQATVTQTGSLPSRPPLVASQPGVALKSPSVPPSVPAEDPELAAFEKSIEHLSVVQRGKKTAEFLMQRNRNKISPWVQRILDKDKNKTPP